MKAIYTKIDDKVYKINQNTGKPLDLTYKPSGVTSTLQIDPSNKFVKQLLQINTLESTNIKSNGQLFKELSDYIKEKKLTEIDTIQNYFKVCIDYMVFYNNKEIEHAQVIRPIECVDKAILLGVGTNNECVYRRVKTFNPKIDFRMRDPLPHGIIEHSKGNYILKINNISVFQSLKEFNEVHNSIYEVPYRIPSSVINADLDNTVMVYSSSNTGVDIQEIRLNFMPRHIEVSLDMVLTNYTVVYNDTDISNILIENIEKKYAEGEGDTDIKTPDDSGTTIVPGDDSDINNKESTIEVYQKCTEETPNALLVVEDLMPEDTFNASKMIKKNVVIGDIPDIEVGDYVIRRQIPNPSKN